MSTALWVVRGPLALAFLLAGRTKVVTLRDELVKWMAWIAATPIALARCIGVAELAGALGLVLPPLTGIAPRLTLAMAGATTFHATRKEYRFIGPTIALLAVALFVVAAQPVWARQA